MRRRDRDRWLALIVGAACATGVLVALTAGGGRRDPGAGISLPDRLAGYSYLTGSVSTAPPGRAIALYQHGFGVESLDFPQAVVLAADDDVYRRLDAAEDRAGAESQGDPGPMLLSPDGRHVALGDHDTTDPDLEVVALATGAIARHDVPRARSVLPVAWSPDGRQIVYVSDDRPTNPHLGAPLEGDLHVLDLMTGDAEPVPGGQGAWAAAVAPDGHRIAIQRTNGRDADLVVVDLDTSETTPVEGGGTVTGPNAWSPDGSLLAVTRGARIVFLDLTERPPATAYAIGVDWKQGESMLGWTGDREVAAVDPSANDTTRVSVHSLDGGESREITRVEGTSSYGVARLQLAAALLQDLTVREAGAVDRGPMPGGFRLTAALLLGLAAAVVASGLLRLTSARRAARAPVG